MDIFKTQTDIGKAPTQNSVNKRKISHRCFPNVGPFEKFWLEKQFRLWQEFRSVIQISTLLQKQMKRVIIEHSRFQQIFLSIGRYNLNILLNSLQRPRI